MKVTADHALHLRMAGKGVREADDPGFIHMGIHPLDSSLDRRMMHDDQRGRFTILTKPRLESGPARFS